MKNISEKQYYLLTLTTITLVIITSLLIANANNKSSADVTSPGSSHLPEAVTIDANSSTLNPVDEIDIFAKEDK